MGLDREDQTSVVNLTNFKAWSLASLDLKLCIRTGHPLTINASQWFVQALFSLSACTLLEVLANHIYKL